jgi:hypothetical protein
MNSLTRAQVIATLGPLDDVIVNQIIGMRPTLEELSEARAWIANDEVVNAGKEPGTWRGGSVGRNSVLTRGVARPGGRG